MEKSLRTPKSKKIDEKHFNREFYIYMFRQMAGKYGISPDQYNQFPESKHKEQKEENKPALQSRIIDLRLRRQNDPSNSKTNEVNEKISTRVDQIFNKMGGQESNIDDIFTAEKANRSELPLYLKNEEKDENQKDQFTATHRERKYESMDMHAISQQFTMRLARSKQIGEDRATKRYNKMRLYAKEHNTPKKEIIDPNYIRPPIVNANPSD